MIIRKLLLGVIAANHIHASFAAEILEDGEPRTNVRRSARVRAIGVVSYREDPTVKTSGPEEITQEAEEAPAAAPSKVKRKRNPTKARGERKRTRETDMTSVNAKHRKKHALTIEDVRLRAGKGSEKDTLFYWHIYAEGKRRGYVSIINSNFPGIGSAPSIQVFINKKDQGKHIGSCAYSLACSTSGLPKIYAHMRKSNLPSKKAATNAGFKEDPSYSGSQLLMVWQQ